MPRCAHTPSTLRSSRSRGLAALASLAALLATPAAAAAAGIPYASAAGVTPIGAHKIVALLPGEGTSQPQIWDARTGALTGAEFDCKGREVPEVGLPTTLDGRTLWAPAWWRNPFSLETGTGGVPGAPTELCDALISSNAEYEPSLVISDDGGKSWRIAGKLPAVGFREGQLLLDRSNALRWGSPAASFAAYVPETGQWVTGAPPPTSPGADGTGSSASPDWEVGPATEVDLARRLDSGTVWTATKKEIRRGRTRGTSWTTALVSGGTVVSASQKVLAPSTTVAVRLDLIKKQEADLQGALRCPHPQRGTVVGFSDVATSSDGLRLWGVTDTRLPRLRCKASGSLAQAWGSKPLVDAYGAQVLRWSSDGGTTWHVLKTPSRPDSILYIDGGAPIVGFESDNCSGLLAKRYEGGKWRTLDCLPVST